MDICISSFLMISPVGSFSGLFTFSFLGLNFLLPQLLSGVIVTINILEFSLKSKIRIHPKRRKK